MRPDSFNDNAMSEIEKIRQWIATTPPNSAACRYLKKKHADSILSEIKELERRAFEAGHAEASQGWVRDYFSVSLLEVQREAFEAGRAHGSGAINLVWNYPTFEDYQCKK
jgi:hypothetical protein